MCCSSSSWGPAESTCRRDRQPNGTWVTQQARNLLLVLEERGRRVRFLVRDRDAKFCRGFDDVFRSEGAEMLVTPVQALNANAYAERWIRTVRAECLDWLLSTGRGHPEQVLRIYVEHDNGHRPHRAFQPESPDASTGPVVSVTTSAVCSDATGSAVCSTSTTDKLHERVSAPYGLILVSRRPLRRLARDGRTLVARELGGVPTCLAGG